MRLSHPSFYRCHGRHAFFLPLILCGLVSSALAISPENVLVLYNADDGQAGPGYQIANHYQTVHPGTHVVGLTGVNDILSGAFDEDVSGTDYLNVLRPQILSAIGTIPDSIDVIVTTKGLPLRIDVGPQPDPNASIKWKSFSSLESELTRIDSIDTIDEMGDQFILAGFPSIDTSLPSNPYYNENVPFVRAGSDTVNGDIRLSSRLDGYSVETVIQSISKAQKVFVVPTGHYVVADDDPTAGIDQIVDRPMQAGDGPGPGLVNLLQNRGQAFVSDYDQADAIQNLAITVAPGPVIGYVSHGTNDGSGGLEADYVLNQLSFQLAKGAVFHSYESYNSQSFDPANTQEDGMIGDWLEIGGTAGLGHVTEPYNGRDNVINEDLFYQMLLPSAGALPGETGLTFVEAAWNATRQLSYVNTVVGDPLMTWKQWMPGDTNLDGEVEFNDFYTMQGNWWKSGTFADGDFNGDNIINADDFDILRANWLDSAALATLGTANIEVWPELDETSGTPFLAAELVVETNLDGDLDVDSDDLEILLASYGVDAGGDADQDGDTDGDDFLMWQRQFQLYTLTADYNFNGMAESKDLEIWENSYGRNRGGDSNGNGVTDGDDFLAWQREVTVPVPALVETQATQATVPEPASASLAFVLATMLVVRRRRRR